ncbi:MAG: NADP-dependent oxidoreductase [Pseudomonadota bacterium]
MSLTNRQWTLKERPTGLVGREHFTWGEQAAPEAGAGQMLLRVLYLSCDPTQRGWLNEGDNYIEPVKIGEPMKAGGVAQVVASNMDGYAPGDFVQGTFGWEDYVVTDGQGPFPIHKVSGDVPLTYNFSAWGVTSLTAYFGLLDVGALKTGDVVLVSGAAGATGAAAGQIARIKGAKKVVGIAGGPDKCRVLTEQLGFDAAIDYKSEDIAARVAELCPDGVDVYYDNVGGPALDAALLNLAMHGRIVICGGISSGYSSWEVEDGPKHYLRLILNSGRMEGFLVLNYMDRFAEAAQQLGAWVQSGEFKVLEHVVEGLENAPDALQGLFTGKNVGKTIIKVADPA